MSALRVDCWVPRFGLAMIALLSLGTANWQSAPAQTRTLASLADVPAFAPAPFHPRTATAIYGSTLFDESPYSSGVYHGIGVRYWH
ncbi:MAG TPA: hypothetical protein VM782_10655 [Stellaceae bacterium]|nr:hypothetical protein [Stellaceae bacterium]